MVQSGCVMDSVIDVLYLVTLMEIMNYMPNEITSRVYM